MGCTNSINPQIENEEEPVKNCTVQIQHQSSKVIKIEYPICEQKEQKVKNEAIIKKEEKIKNLKNNKGFIELSIETSYCVDKLLNTLAQNEMFQDNELKGLMSKNNQALVMKQNRYKNLEAREEKMELELKKELEKNERHVHLRKTVPAKTREEYMSERKYHKKGHELTNVRSQKISHPITEVEEEKENLQLKHSHSDYLQTDYKSKFIKRIDMFRSQVNTLVAKENIEF